MTVYNLEAIRSWVDALRSGEYEQGQGTLHRFGGKYCCLGVLCDLAIKNGVEVDVQQDLLGSAFSYNGQQAFPPPVVMDWIGAPVTSRLYDDVIGGGSLPNWNDSGLFTFGDIADIIERQWL